MSTSAIDSSSPSDNAMDTIDDSLSTVDTETEEQQSEAGDADENESAPPLLHPDPSRMISCLRAPCLKRNAIMESSTGSSSLNGSGTSSPQLSTSPPNTLPVHSFSGIKVLCAAMPKRQVHFDAAPPEAGLTHSGDNYDRRPIECTQGGSQMDLSLPPRGTCPRYADDADDEACEDEDEDEESKQERLRGFARWAKLKNGGSILGGATGLKLSNTNERRGSDENKEQSNECSVPVHGIRSFGGLSGKSCLTSSISSDQTESTYVKDSTIVGKEEVVSSLSVEEDENDSESEGRQEAFRKAVYAALSKDPNATPMPSPSVRPRWECITSYFDPSDEVEGQEEGKEATPDIEEVLVLDVEQVQPEEVLHSPIRTPLSKEQGVCKVTTWTQDQAANKDEDTPLTSKMEFCLTLPPPKVSPSASVEGSSITHPSSSPMSSRCSSSDAWSSACGGGPWSGSEQDAFDFAFSKGVTVNSPATTSHPTTTTATTTATTMTSSSSDLITSSELLPPSTAKTDLQLMAEKEGSQSSELDVDHQEVDHEQATSSSSSGGGPGWISSCCTSPELSAVDVTPSTIGGGALSKATSANSMTVKAALIQRLEPLDLQRQGSLEGRALDFLSPCHETLIDRSGYLESFSSPNSGESSPHILSADEGEGCRKSSNLFRCSSKKVRKARRTTSGSSGARDDHSPEDSSRPTLSPRSKSMSAAPSVKRVSLLKRTSAFHNDEGIKLDDEGALGGF